MQPDEQQEFAYRTPSEIYPELENAAPDQKREILIRLMQSHPRGLLDLQPGSEQKIDPGPRSSWGARSGAHLESVNLQGLNLAQANLQAATLRNALLDKVVLDKADLAGADLAGAKLREANLRESDLRGALLEDCDLQGANLRFADLRGATLEGANLSNADLWGANLEGAILTNANLQGVTLHESNLEDADLSGADVRNAKITAANLRNVNLRSADLRGSQLRGVNLQSAILAEANLQSVDLTGCDLSHVFFAKTWLEKTRLSRSQIGRMTGEEGTHDFEGAAQGYFALEKNFSELGDKNASSWAYRKRRRMEKHFAAEQFRRSFRERTWLQMLKWQSQYIADQSVEWLCDYGESVPRVLVSLLVVYVLFTLLYAVTGSVVRVSQTQAATVRNPTSSFLDFAIFSLLAMTTSGSPAVGLEPAYVAVHLLTGIQALLGISLTGLLGYVVGNRIRR